MGRLCFRKIVLQAFYFLFNDLYRTKVSDSFRTVLTFDKARNVDRAFGNINRII